MFSFTIQYAVPPEFGEKWGTECLNTRFPLPILLCAGYSVKLIFIYYQSMSLSYDYESLLDLSICSEMYTVYRWRLNLQIFMSTKLLHLQYPLYQLLHYHKLNRLRSVNIFFIEKQIFQCYR